MGSQTVAKAGSVSNVNKDLAELTRLSKDPVANLDAMNKVLERIAVARLTTQQKNKLAGVEQDISPKLDDAQRMSLYLFALPRGYAFVKVSEITELQEAIGTLRTFSKTPLLYLLEIQDFYTRFGDAIQAAKAAKDINGKLTAAELEFVKTPAESAKPEAPKKMVPKPVAAPAGIEVEEEVEISSAHAEAAVETEKSYKHAKAKTLRTEISLLPSEARLVGTAPKAPDLTPNTKLNQVLGPSGAATVTDSGKTMFLGQFNPSKYDISTAGTTYYLTIMQWLNNATGQTGDLNPAIGPQGDARWQKLMQLYGGYNINDPAARQQVVNTLNDFRRGDYFAGLKSLPDSSPLKNIIVSDINTICQQMVTNIPILVLTMGGDLELFHFKGGKLTLGPHAWVSHVTSEQYKANFDETNYTLSIKPTGYTAKQMMTRVGVTGKYRPWDYATVQLDLAAETPYGVQESGDSTGQAQLVKLDKTQGLIEASFTDQSGRTAGLLKLPLYYAFRGTWRTPSNSFSLTGAGGLGIGRLKGMPVMVVADIGSEIRKGSSEYPQPIADTVWRAGIGITPSSAKGDTFPMKFYYVQGTGGQPSPLGIKTESNIGGGAEAKVYGIKLGVEARYRKATAISGLPITGPGNVLVLFNLDASEFVHRAIFKTER